MTAKIPHAENYILILDSFSYAFDIRKGRNDLIQLQLVEDASLASSIETRQKDFSFVKQSDLCLHPAGAILIKPDAYVLCAQLLVSGEVAHRHPHGAEGL